MLNILQMLKDLKGIEGTVVNVEFVDGFMSSSGNYNRYHSCQERVIVGYDSVGMPIVETYLRGRYKVSFVDSEGKMWQFEHQGKPYEIGSKQRFHGVKR